MNWKDVTPIVGRVAPILGTLIGGPAGAALGALVSSALGVSNTPDAVHEALKVNPDAAIKLAQIEKEREVELRQLLVSTENNRMASETAAVLAVNQTMQAETRSEHWPSYSWRPFIGFVFGAMMLGIYFVLPLAHVPVPTVPTEAWLAMGSVLGVASFFRGKAQADPANPALNRG